MDIKKAAQAEREYLVSIRREFHQHPELSLHEFRTAQRIEGDSVYPCDRIADEL